MPYDKQVWTDGPAGGTPLRDERLNHVENGLAAVAATLDAMVDQVAALAAGKAPTAIAKIAGGSTAARPAPSIDAVYRDHDLGRVMYGTGSKWVTGRGVDVVGASAGNAPQNFAAEVQPDNSVICTWLPVVGATSYKLYEVQSPAGVAGATVLSTTTVTRAPGSLRTYEYWVTAIVGSAESAQSNHALAILPFGGGGTGIGSPAALLALGVTGGFWNVGIGYATGHVDYSFATLLTGATYPPYFVLNAAENAVQFQVAMNGAKLDAATVFERCELRELTNDGLTKAAWTAASGTHSLEYSFKINHIQPIRPQVIVGHICNAAGEVVTVRVGGTVASALDVIVAINGVDQATRLFTGYTIGTTVTVKLELLNGTLRIYANGILKITSGALLAAGAGHYFRLGAFPQSGIAAGGFEAPAEYASVDISGLTVVHVPSLGVSVDDGTEAAKLLNWGAVIDGDEFEYTGPPVAGKWSMYDGPGHDNNGLRRPSAFTVAGGILTCTGDAGGTTGGMSFYRSEKYCRIEWRVRTYSVTPTASGNRYHAVLIDWPTSDSWPQGGEYDFYECDPETGKYEAYLHIPGNDGGAQEYVSKSCDIANWHNIAFEWNPSGIKGWLDGVQVFAYTGSYIQAPGPMQFTFQLDNFFGTNMLPGKFEAKWMRIYTRPS